MLGWSLGASGDCRGGQNLDHRWYEPLGSSSKCLRVGEGDLYRGAVFKNTLQPRHADGQAPPRCLDLKRWVAELRIQQDFSCKLAAAISQL